MLLINLDSQSYKSISNGVSKNLRFAEFLDHNAVGSLSIDQRIMDIFEFISESASPAIMREMQLEPPFIYAPYVRPMTGKSDKIYHKLLIPIGDSIFNGHPKVGNGLEFHLKHVTKVNDAMLYFYG